MYNISTEPFTKYPKLNRFQRFMVVITYKKMIVGITLVLFGVFGGIATSRRVDTSLQSFSPDKQLTGIITKVVRFEEKLSEESHERYKYFYSFKDPEGNVQKGMSECNANVDNNQKAIETGMHAYDCTNCSKVLYKFNEGDAVRIDYESSTGKSCIKDMMVGRSMIMTIACIFIGLLGVPVLMTAIRDMKKIVNICNDGIFAEGRIIRRTKNKKIERMMLIKPKENIEFEFVTADGISMTAISNEDYSNNPNNYENDVVIYQKNNPHRALLLSSCEENFKKCLLVSYGKK